MTPDNFINKVEHIIEKHLISSNLNGTLIAQELGISRMHLHRKLRQLADKNTSQIIHEVRLKKATSLLQQRQYSIADIAQHVGFSSHSYFTRTFKEHYKMSPFDYRMNNNWKISASLTF